MTEPGDTPPSEFELWQWSTHSYSDIDSEFNACMHKPYCVQAAKDLAAARAGYATVYATILELTADRDRLAAENAALKRRYDRLEREYAAARGDWAVLQAENAALRERIK